jgi:hypothetical protein
LASVEIVAVVVMHFEIQTRFHRICTIAQLAPSHGNQRPHFMACAIGEEAVRSIDSGHPNSTMRLAHASTRSLDLLGAALPLARAVKKIDQGVGNLLVAPGMIWPFFKESPASRGDTNANVATKSIQVVLGPEQLIAYSAIP